MFTVLEFGPSVFQEDPNIQGLLNVFAVLSQNKLTLRTFLERIVDCENEKVKTYVGHFYSKSGPSHITRLWMKKRPSDTELANVALGYVLPLARNELMNLSMDSRLRLERSSLSVSTVQNFTVAHINRCLESGAPLIYKLIQGLTTTKERSVSRQHSLAVPIIGSILAFTRSNRSNYLQLMMGLYFYSAGCTRKVIDVLHGAGLSVSFPTVNRLLENLSEDARERFIKASKQNPWLVVYDNINFAKRKYDQRVGNADDFESGTTATLIIGKNLSPGSAQQIRESYARLSLVDFMMDEMEEDHVKQVSRFHIIEELKKNLEGYDHCSTPNIEIHQLSAERTKTFPLPIMKIDESSLEGNKKVVETIIEDMLGLEKDWFNDGKMVVIAGDLSTVKNLRGLKYLRSDEHSPYHRLDWAIPVAQLFHMQMLLAKTIVHNYRGSASEQGSLEQLATMLTRKRIFSDNPEFHAMDELLRQVFSATVLRLWEVSEEGKEMLNLKKDSNDAAFSNTINEKVMEIVDRELTAPNIQNTSSRNAILFLRDMILYIELSSAIKIGDIGRIEKALKWLTIIFHAGSNPHYANELMHFRCFINHVWDEQTKVAVLSSMLVNKSGGRYGFKATDLYQEHNNRSIKHVYYGRRGDTSFDTLRERVSMNIETFDKVKEEMEKQFQAPRNKRKHATVSSESAIDDILMVLRENNILGHDDASCVQKCDGITAAKDLLLAGTNALQDGKRIRSFIEKYTYDSQGLGNEPEVGAQESNPIDDKSGTEEGPN